MSRYRGPRAKILRRLGDLDGLMQNPKIKTNKNEDKDNNQKIGPYKLRLMEKQKLRYNYGVSEKQLFRYVKKARKTKGSTGLKILELLEMRLDTIVFRLGWANSISQARQYVSHGHVKVNNNKVNIPSFECNVGDKILINDKIVNNNKTLRKIASPPQFLELDKMQGTIKELVTKDDFTVSINELLIVEYYSRR